MADAGSVLLVHGPSAGGIRRHVATLATGLRDRGWQVRVGGPGAPAVVDQRDVDLVHAHGLRTGWLASLVPRRKPLVVTAHNIVLDGMTGRRSALLRQLEAALPGRVDAVIATSATVAARLGVVTVIPAVGPPPVPRHSPEVVRRVLRVPADSPLAVTVARLHPQKGLDTLLDAASKVPGTRFVVVGEGPDEGRLRARVHDDGLSDIVTFSGPSANAADELGAADVVVITSVWESGPLVLSEAMELGRPVVTTPVGFAPEIVEDGVTGRLVPVGDSGALAGAVIDVIGDPDGAAGMARAGQERVRAWLDRGRLIDQVIDVYRATLDRR
jgi:glycosyltransferase involved in cell wall biosynthesis